VLNDEYVVGDIDLVPAHLYRGHILFSMRTPGLPLMCFRWMRFLKINISQGSVVTLFRCGDVCNNPFIADFLLSITVKEFLKMVLLCWYIHQSIQLTFWATLYMLLFLRFLRFFTFFQNPKNVTFYVFCRVSYVFSNYAQTSVDRC